MPCATTWVHDTAVQLVRKLKEEREFSKEEAAAVAQALAKVKARNQEVGTELASGLARKAAAEQEVSNAEQCLQSTRESILRLEQQEAVAAVSLAHKDSQISLVQQCQNFVEHQAQLLQNQQDETKKHQQEALRARQDASSAQETAFKVKLEADNLHQTLDAVKASRDKHAEEVEKLRRMLDDVKTLCGKHAAEAQHFRCKLSEIEATRAKLVHQVSHHEMTTHAGSGEHQKVYGDRGVEENRAELHSDADTSQALDKNEIMASTSKVKESVNVASVLRQVDAPRASGKNEVTAATSTVREIKLASTVNVSTVLGQADASQASDKKETTVPMSTAKDIKPAGTVRDPIVLKKQALDRKGTTAATSTVKETKSAGTVDVPIVLKGNESAEATRQVLTLRPPTDGNHTDQFEEQRNHQADEPGQLHPPDGLEAGKPQQDAAGPSECSKVVACSITVPPSTPTAPNASQPGQVSSTSPNHELPKTAAVTHSDLPQGPRPWRSATACPPAKYQRISGPAALSANSCQECGLKKQVFLDASDNMHYCSGCWVAFYGRLPMSTAGTTHGMKRPMAADHTGLRTDWRCKQGTPNCIKQLVAADQAKVSSNLRCKQGGRFKCPKCPNTFTVAKNLRRHLDSGSCRGRLE